MTNENYNPPMKPKLELANEKTSTPAQIRVSKEYGASLPLTDIDRATLYQEMTGQSICPEWYWFRDTPETRKILRVEE